jgi:histidinol-phosphatase (PHP family)
MQVDCHMHTPLCGHADGMPRQYVAAAARAGIGLVTFTCHIPMAGDAFGGPGIRMQPVMIDDYLELVDDAADCGRQCGVEVLCGIEAEIYPDEAIMQAMDLTLRVHPFDFVLGSLHHQVPIHRARRVTLGIDGDDEAVIRDYFEMLGAAAGSGRFHSLSHPDVLRLYGALRRPFEPARHAAVIQACLDQVAAAGVCLEINTSGRIKGDYVEHPDPLIRGWAIERGIPFTLGSDAHAPSHVGQHFGPVLRAAASQGLRAIHYFRSGQRHAIPLAANGVTGHG